MNKYHAEQIYMHMVNYTKFLCCVLDSRIHNYTLELRLIIFSNVVLYKFMWILILNFKL